MEMKKFGSSNNIPDIEKDKNVDNLVMINEMQEDSIVHDQSMT